ncbi:MAG: phosphatase PAP2 family protein [Gemmatimonadaceae bacterium]
MSIRRSLLTLLIVAAGSREAVAQAPVDSAVRRSLVGGLGAHPTLLTAAGITTGAAALSLFDSRIQHEMREFRASSSSGMRHVSLMTSSIGGYLPLAAGGTLAVTGWAVHNDFTRNLGVDVTRSVLVSGVITAALKGTVGRARPRVNPDDADMFYPGRGFFNNDRASFPSGHTSAAFAGASVLAFELSKAHPHHSRWVTMGLYGAATAVGFSRMYENAHWASDVFAGAAIGTLSGLHIARQRTRTP